MSSREEFLSNFQDHLLGIDDTFQFKCLECGKCCRHREDLLLNSRDLFNVAKKLGISTEQALEQYCETYIGRDSKVPVARLKPQGAGRVCPLLKGSKCSVHDSKPTICAAFPLGRIIEGEEISDGLQSDKPMKLQYILNPISCGRRKHKHTVRSWLEKFNIPIDDEFYILWSQLILTLSSAVREYEEQGMSDALLGLLWQNIGSALYVAYDTEADFMQQFMKNCTTIQGLFSILKEQFPNGIKSTKT
ncbi:MAG: YkgJ family cysteine cluster protein [Oscillospiraceae bacterium]|nr:YkgJ family cysteine cluster protein [Oscillospiraceae bacterium]